MANSVEVVIKHAGKSHPVTLDLDQPGQVFKHQIYSLTGIDPERVKVVVKGGMLKDDADMRKLAFKEGQTIMVIGTAGPLPQAPPKPIVFLEDMDDAELALAVAQPVGLQNLGNTCYMNSTVQVLRAIPELQESLNSFPANSSRGQTDVAVTSSLRDLYQNMARTQDEVPPLAFLSMLHEFNPQFAERSRTNGQYSQQDAQEAWASILNAAKANLKKDGQSFVEKYMTGELETTLKSAEAPEEEATISKDRFLDLKCPISASTSYMMTGITEDMKQDIEKTSPTLNRTAVYQQTSRISRLPSYLTISFTRFYWRREIGKKTKIMKRVAFPHDLDVLDLVTPSLHDKMKPLNEKLKAVDKDRRERAKIRRRAKVLADQTAMPSAPSTSATPTANPSDDPPEEMAVDEPAVPKAGELVDEKVARETELKELNKLVDESLRADVGANWSGLYELAGIVSHKGAHADGGHYVGWCAADDAGEVDEEKRQWWKFDDEKVSKVGMDKIKALEGGGEDHSAYILLYRSKKLD